MVELTVRRALELSAQRNAARIALRFGERAITYAELDSSANRMANALAGIGVRKGDRVAAAMPNCPEYVAFAIACAKAGFVMVPLNYRFTASEYETQLRDCGAVALLYDESLRRPVLEAAAKLPKLKRFVHGQPDVGEIGCLEDALASANDRPPQTRIAETDLFYLGYTSGTSGKPKGAQVTHRNRALAYHYWALEFDIRDTDICLHCGPFHHTAPFTFVLTQLYLGGCVVILDSFSAIGALQAIARECITWGFMVPYMFDRILELPNDSVTALDLRSLRTLISGASSLPTRTKEGLLKRLPQLGLHEFYGATEAGVITNLRPEDQATKVRCVGRPIADIEVEVRSETGDAVMPGEIGNLWIRGPTLFDGYFNAADKTAEVFDGDWCTLGDIGRIDAGGYVYIVDRSKDVIKSGGVNIYPMEIEEVLLRSGLVRDVAVIGIPDERWGESVHAVVVGDGGMDGESLIGLCRQHLAAYKVPRSIEFRAELPRNTNGKILKRVLREECSAKPAHRTTIIHAQAGIQ